FEKNGIGCGAIFWDVDGRKQANTDSHGEGGLVLGVVSLDVFKSLRKTLTDENQHKHREEAGLRDDASVHELSPRVSRPTVAAHPAFAARTSAAGSTAEGTLRIRV